MIHGPSMLVLSPAILFLSSQSLELIVLGPSNSDSGQGYDDHSWGPTVMFQGGAGSNKNDTESGKGGFGFMNLSMCKNDGFGGLGSSNG